MMRVANSYPNQKCPDCQDDIAPTAIEGDECLNCGHIFWSQPNTETKVCCVCGTNEPPFSEDKTLWAATCCECEVTMKRTVDEALANDQEEKRQRQIRDEVEGRCGLAELFAKRMIEKGHDVRVSGTQVIVQF